MKILGIDLGDRWVGTALSDPMGITCKPYQTIELANVEAFLARVLPLERVTTVIVGYPKTFSGGQSAQTARIVEQKEALEKLFAEIKGTAVQWLLWDERLSSKRANELQQQARTPEAKQKSHSIAAAFILQSYLDNLAFKNLE